MKRFGTIVVVSLLAATAAGCGGDDGGETTAEDTGVTQEEFAAQATDICARVNEELTQIKNFPREGPQAIEQGLSDLEALEPPAGEEETFQQFIQAGRDALQELEQARRPPQQDPFAEFTQLGTELGIEGGCTGAGQGGG